MGNVVFRECQSICNHFSDVWQRNIFKSSTRGWRSLNLNYLLMCSLLSRLFNITLNNSIIRAATLNFRQVHIRLFCSFLSDWRSKYSSSCSSWVRGRRWSFHWGRTWSLLLYWCSFRFFSWLSRCSSTSTSRVIFKLWNIVFAVNYYCNYSSQLDIFGSFRE